MAATLYYIHDPMCSWCWAFKKIYEDIVTDLANEVNVKRLLGGLAPDTEEYMSEEMKAYIKNHWQTIQEKVPGIEFNYSFWDTCKPRRATYPACRAVIAARNQGSEYDEKMTIAIQEGYYLHARNPSEPETLIAFAGELKLNTEKFTQDLFSAETNDMLMQEILLTQQMGIRGFPSMLLELNGDTNPVPINYTNSEEILISIREKLLSNKGL